MKAQDDNGDFFIGWADTPPADRRFFVRAGLGLLGATAALGAGLGALQRAPGRGTWNPGAVREWRGVVTADPYAMLRTADLGSQPRTALLSCLGKCGVAARIGSLAGRAVVVTGSLIERDGHAMIAVDEVGDWIRPDRSPAPDPRLRFPEPERLGEVDLAGEILDSKCWFGAMRPADGKIHKACASLCIRGGIPPALFAPGPQRLGTLLIMASRGRGYGPGLLGLVADPVRVRGRVYRQGDLLWIDAPLESIRRL
jgi:hypothetical protein